jgi:hypothetical protein
MDASRLAPLNGACADPASGRKHRSDFPFAPPRAPIGAHAPVLAQGPKRVVEARKRIVQTRRVSRKVPFEGEHRSLRDRDVGRRLVSADRCLWIAIAPVCRPRSRLQSAVA